MKLNIHIAYCMCNTESQEKVHDFTSTVCIVYSTFILDADIVRKNLMGFVLCLVIRFIRSKAVKNFAVTQKNCSLGSHGPQYLYGRITCEKKNVHFEKNCELQ